MKLYYSPGACSLSPHIVLREAGLAFEPVLASTKTHKLQDGTDYYTINPKGYVPLLELDNGERLSEGPVIVQYIADQAPAKKLAPAAGTMARYRLQEWLNFISTELHKAYSPLFSAKTPEEHKATVRETLSKRLDYVARVRAKLAAVERLYLDELMKSRDALEGLQAFIAKRPAIWEHC